MLSGKKLTSGEMAALVIESYKILSTRLHLKASEVQSEGFTVIIPENDDHSPTHSNLLKELATFFEIKSQIKNISHLRLDDQGDIEFNI